MDQHVEELRKKYMHNPPEGITAKEIQDMPDEAPLDMDYFLNEDDRLSNICLMDVCSFLTPPKTQFPTK